MSRISWKTLVGERYDGVSGGWFLFEDQVRVFIVSVNRIP